MTQVGWMEVPFRTRLRAEEIDQELRNTGRFFVLEPMGGVGEGEEFGVGAVAQTFVSHFGQEEIVELAPQNARGDAHGFVWKFGASSKQGAIPVDYGGLWAWLRPPGAVLGPDVSGEGGGGAGGGERHFGGTIAEGGGKGVRQPREVGGEK